MYLLRYKVVSEWNLLEQKLDSVGWICAFEIGSERKRDLGEMKIKIRTPKRPPGNKQTAANLTIQTVHRSSE